MADPILSFDAAGAMSTERRAQLVRRLDEIAREEDVRILLAWSPAAAPGASTRPTATTTCGSSTPAPSATIWP